MSTKGWADTTTDDEEPYQRGEPAEAGMTPVTPKQVRKNDRQRPPTVTMIGSTIHYNANLSLTQTHTHTHTHTHIHALSLSLSLSRAIVSLSLSPPMCYSGTVCTLLTPLCVLVSTLCVPFIDTFMLLFIWNDLSDDGTDREGKARGDTHRPFRDDGRRVG